MSKWIVMILAMLCLCGCGGREPAAQLKNPMEKVDSLEAINARIECSMHSPEGMTVENESFYVINSDPMVGQYRFDLDGITYTLRAAVSNDDISGVYLKDGSLGAIADRTNSDTLIFEEGQWTRWFDGKMQYSLYSSSAEPTTDALLSIRGALQ